MFFLIVGQAGKGDLESESHLGCLFLNLELSLTVPITNSLAFLFTVLGEWFAEGRAISGGMPSYDFPTVD